MDQLLTYDLFFNIESVNPTEDVPHPRPGNDRRGARGLTPQRPGSIQVRIEDPIVYEVRGGKLPPLVACFSRIEDHFYAREKVNSGGSLRKDPQLEVIPMIPIFKIVHEQL